MDIVWTVAILGVAVLLWTAAAHNGLASLRQDVRGAWGVLDEQLRRRYELLSPLVAVARDAGEGSHPALSAALTAKNQAAVAFNPQQLAAAEASLTASLRSLFDQPPQALANNRAFADARTDLAAVARSIELAVSRHNAAVQAYNAALVSFPHDVVAALFGFKPQPPFELGAGS
jgi:LemA protein